MANKAAGEGRRCPSCRDPEKHARFQRKAHLLASLNHSNIATFHGLENEGDIEFPVLELVEGGALAERIARGAVALEQALALFDQIAHGLEAARRPANIKITPDGHARILDFGLGKVFAGAESGQASLSHSPTITRESRRFGEPR